ncbi:hypothetical protein CBR_g53943 [Chara braunii]|uniref:CCHC-type domain-containing protein n=1 Tax=Chara braunii TaxID=69332 RepID=A0A388MBJ5_CHABU|nr:hypothetical protein CBR_g53943 [Chara braunii]|eukprot:GBG91885.1 hypothetical protein CBR_g53943 [Chara braunii]
MPEGMADGGTKLLTIDDLVEALDKRERAPSNVPKVEIFHFKGDRVSEWLDLVEQALVGLADHVKFQRIMRYVLLSHHKEVHTGHTVPYSGPSASMGPPSYPLTQSQPVAQPSPSQQASQASVAGGGGQGQGGQGNGGRGHGGRGGGGRGRGGNGGGRGGGWNGRGGQNQGRQGSQGGGQGYGRPRFDWWNATCWHCGEMGHTVRFCQQRRDDELAGLISTCMDGDIYDRWGKHIDPKTPGGIRQEALRRAAAGPPAASAMFRIWKERQDPGVRVEEVVGENEEVTQQLRAGTTKEEPIVVESDEETQEVVGESALTMLERMEDLLVKVGSYHERLRAMCERAREWKISLLEVMLYGSGPESSPGTQGCPSVATTGAGPRSGMTFRPPTSHGRVPRAQTRGQSKATTSQGPSQAPSRAPPRKDPEPERRKEVVEVQEEEDEGDDEEDERLRQEEDRRVEQRAKKRGVQGGVEPSLHDGVPKRRKYAVRLEEGFDVERMVDKLLEGHNDLMNLKDILASAPRLRGELKGRPSRRLVPNVHLSSILPREIEWTEVSTRMDWKCVACGLVDLKVRDQPSITMVDTGAEMNIIRERDTTMLGLEVDHSDHGVLHGANCKAIFCGTASNVMVEIGRVRARTCFFVMPDVDHPILLGRSFICRTETLVFNKHEGTMILALSDPACGNYEIIKCRNTGPESGRNRLNLDSFTFEESEYARLRLREEREEEGAREVLSLSLNDVNKAMEVVAAHDMADPQAIKALREQDPDGGTMKRRHCAYAFNNDERGRLDVDKIPMIRIHTVPHEPWNLRGARYPNPDEVKKVVDYLDGKMRTYVADYSSGPYASPSFCFINPKGTLRWVQDLQRLNAVTVRDVGGLPNADALSESCVGRPIISLIDLYSGYDQFPVYPPDRPVTAMHTPRGLIHMNVAPQGWTYAVAMVQRHMIRAMQTVSPHITQPYIDDLAVKGPKEKEEDEVMPGVRRFVWKHVQDIDQVLGLLEEHNLTTSGPKSKHCMREATILGFVCNEEGRRPDVKKTDKILEWSVPFQSITDVRSFLGTCGFWRSFVKDFATKTEHLRKLGNFDQKGGASSEKGELFIPESQDDEFEEGEIRETFRDEEYDGIYWELGLLWSCEMRDRDAGAKALKMRHLYLVRDGHLFIRRQVGNPKRIVCGRNRQIDVIVALHDGIAGGHIGVSATCAKISELYRSDGMLTMVIKYYQSCVPCQQRSAQRPGEHLHPRLEREVGAVVHLDLLFMPLGEDENNYIFDARDNLTGFVDGRAIRTKTDPVLASKELRPPSPLPLVQELDIPRKTSFGSLATHLDVSQWEASRLGEGSVEPACYVPLEEPLDPEVETDMRDREEPQDPEMAVGWPDPVRPQIEEVITVGDDTPPCSPVPEPPQRLWTEGIPEPGSEEIPESPPAATFMPEQEAEEEGQGMCERARMEVPPDLPPSAHEVKGPVIEEPVPMELPPVVPCTSERMGAEETAPEGQGPRVGRAQRETREEKSARVRVRLDEIHAKQAKMETTGIEPTPPVEPKTNEQRIDELWARYEITSFQWYNLLSNELRVKELEVEHLTTQLAEERVRSKAREVEWERRFGEMSATMDRLSAAWEACRTGPAGADIQGRGMQASPNRGVAVEVPRQSEPMEEAPLDAVEEESDAQESLMAMSTEMRGSHLHELATAMGIGTPQERPQGLDAPEHAPRLGELRAELGSWATGTDSGGSDSRRQQQQEVMSEPATMGGSQPS